MEQETRKKIQITGLFALIGLALSFLYTNFYFLRLPARTIPNDNSLLVSPANGKVVAVRKFDLTAAPDPSEYITEQKDSPLTFPGAVRILASDVAPTGYIISIALNLSNVHYQRAPAQSIVINKIYTPGSFNNALKMDGENFFRYENEHNEILLSDNAGGFKYKVVQIAGYLARRIEDYVTIGQQVEQGDVIGLINFGSQVTVLVPSSVNILVKEGDILIDGETPIASTTTS